MRNDKAIVHSGEKSSLDTVRISNSAQSTSFFQRLSFRMGVGCCLFVVLVMTATYYVAQTRGREVVLEQANKLNSKIGETIVLKLNERLSSAESLTIALANLALILPKDEATFQLVIPSLIDNAGMKNLIAGGGIWPEPSAFKENVERHSFFWGRNQQGVLQFYDEYNNPDGKGYHHEEWYVPARYMKKGQVYWSRSYMDPYSHEPMVTCMVPMWDELGFHGVATIDLKLAGLSEFMIEQAKLIGGYALAVDRNNRLLSLPGDDKNYFSNLSNESNFPTMDELALSNPGFDGLLKILIDIDVEILKKANVSNTENLFDLSKRLTVDSYQINLAEASMIAAMLLGEQYLLQEEKHSLLSTDPILNEPVSVRVFTMLNTNWKLVVAMPLKYTDAVVSEITDSMMTLLFMLLAISGVIYGVFFKAAFLLPLNKLTSQVRRLVSREDYVTRLNTNGADELSQLAAWFNIRTTQLSEALDKLHDKNAALDEARLESEQANRTKNIFLASMSHDIRTPMNAIVGMSELLGKSELGAEQSNYSRVINSSAQALLLLINDIMDFSKIEANELNLEQIAFNLRDTIDDCADLISFQALEKNLEFIYFLSPGINPYLLGDPSRIRQIILNLAGNALKFTDSGRVELWIETTHQSDESVNLHVEVRDTGIGLSSSAKEGLFLPFLQGDDSTTRKFGGTGLGLTISKHLAELMGGSIEFRSIENTGTTFTFSVKLKIQHKSQDIPSEQASSQTKNMLFVLGQNHFQNAVIERYADATNYESHIFNSLQSWLSAIEACESSLCVSLCGDLSLLGDLNRLSARLPPNLDQHRMIILKSQNDVYFSDFKALLPQLNLLPVTLPLKFDVFKNQFNVVSDSDQTISNENVLLKPFNHKKILVVEDNKVNQQVIMIMLRHLGLNAEVACDGLEAVEALQNKYYDLILMDWQMPRMDGLEATRRIRALSFETKPIIIAVTANAMSGDIEKCLEAGMDDYLSKPIRREKLSTTLGKWLV
ncbi:MAG: signal transduction histidine kinase/BarA-like signal transduction histidine kinase [Alteromonadaceae bacterium]|jgi:signal transduction histidine kinase/BarA-like signal transduction histidine kinase